MIISQPMAVLPSLPDMEKKAVPVVHPGGFVNVWRGGQIFISSKRDFLWERGNVRLNHLYNIGKTVPTSCFFVGTHYFLWERFCLCSHKRSHRFLYVNLYVLLLFNVIAELRSRIPTGFTKFPLRARERLTRSNTTFMNVSRFYGQFSGQKKTAAAVKKSGVGGSVFRFPFARLRLAFWRLWRAGATDNVEAAMPTALALDVSPFAML